MTFSQWLQNKFLEWEKSTGHRQTYTSFARYLKVRQPSLTRWLNEDNPPSLENIQLLASKLGPEIYDLLGLTRPDTIPLDRLPHQFRDRLANAIYEVNSELGSHDLSNDSPEAEDIVIKIFEKHGLKYIKTIKP